MSTDLATLLRPTPDAAGDVAAWVEQRLAARGCTHPEAGADDEADPRHAYWWLLRMAARTHRRAEAPLPPVEPDLLAALERRLAERPAREDEHAQLPIDPASTLRRARVVQAFVRAHPGPVLAVGDDDAVTLALDLLGVRDLHAVDIDERVLAFLRDASDGRVQCARVDVLNQPVPASLRKACAAAIADPIRSLDPTLGFLLFGAAALRRGASTRLFYCDHPDWTFEHAIVLETLARAGLAPVATHADLHEYPLDPALFDVARIAAAVGEDPAWLRAVVERTSGFSHLYELSRAS